MKGRGHRNALGDESVLGQARSRLARVAFGSRYLLVLEDGEAADPPAFLTAIPSWKIGDEFLGGTDLQKFRIVEINTQDPPEEFHGVFVVEAADDQLGGRSGHVRGFRRFAIFPASPIFSTTQ
jgi:hypothetical protein